MNNNELNPIEMKIDEWNEWNIIASRCKAVD